MKDEIPQFLKDSFSKKTLPTNTIPENIKKFMVEYAAFYSWGIGDNYPKIFQLMKQGISVLPKCGLVRCEKPVEVLKSTTHKLSSGCCQPHALEATSLKKYGTTNPSKTDESIKKIKATNLERYGNEQCLKNSNILNKAKQTNIEKYGFDNPMKSKKVQEKSKQTNIEKYGFDNPMKVDSIKEKLKKSCFEKYGVDNAMQSNEVKEKSRNTCIDKYGVEYTGATQQVMDKRRKTLIERYGVEHQMHVDEFSEKAFINGSINAFSKKEYCWSTGEISVIQGYEQFILSQLEKCGYNFCDVTNDRKIIPKIRYNFESKNRKYYPDFYISKENLIIEVKSEYLLEKEREKNIAKFNAVLSMGFDFHLDVRNYKGEVVKTDPLWDCYKKTIF